VRWEELFDDLEAQLGAARAADLAGEVADRTRREVARLRLVDRLRPAVDHPVEVTLPGPLLISGRLRQVGSDWFLVTEAREREALVLTWAVLGITGLGAVSAEPGSEGRVAGRLGAAHALRGIARDRAPVAAVLIDGTSVFGTLDRVGADFVEIAEHAPGEPRRRGDVRAVRTVPMAAVAAVRRG
jgi:hypothetical protein